MPSIKTAPIVLTGRSDWGMDVGKDGGDWRDQAACSPETADLFWPADRPTEDPDRPFRLSPNAYAALALCEACPVQAICLEEELAKGLQPWPRIVGGHVFTSRGRHYKPRPPIAPKITDPDDERHGTAYGYNLGCRCDRCRRSYAKAQARRRDRQRMNARVPAPPCGTSKAARRHRRFGEDLDPECKQAEQEYARQRQGARREAARQRRREAAA